MLLERYVADQVAKGDLRVVWCPTDEMIADFLTKPLQGKAFVKFLDLLMGADYIQDSVSLKLLGLISCENLWLLIARHSALQERGTNDQVIKSLA